MNQEDFDFSHDPVSEELGATPSTFNNIPLQVLAHTPVEQLPPTILPSGQQRPIQQLLRSNRQLRRAPHQLRRPGTCDLSLQSSNATESGDMAADENSMPLAKETFGSRKRGRFNWSEEELREFYEFLSQYGTDFNAIAVMYPGRSREDVKRLYHRELRRRGDDVQRALAARGEIDLGAFKARLWKRVELRRGPTRKLDQEEEEALRLIEMGTLELQPADGEGGDKNKENEGGAGEEKEVVVAAERDFAFDVVDEKNITAQDQQEIKIEEKYCGGTVDLGSDAQCDDSQEPNKTAFLENSFACEFSVAEEKLEDDYFWD